MGCNFSDFQIDCNQRYGNCDQRYRDCLDKIQTLRDDCQKELDKLIDECKKKMLSQGGIWGTVGAGGAFAGLLLFPGPGWIAAAGIVAIAGGIGFLGGAASKAADCNDDIEKKKQEYEGTVKKAVENCKKEKEACKKRKECCATWNDLMFRLGENFDYDKAFQEGFTTLKNAGCDGLWNDFKDIWNRCCKE